MNSSTSYWGLLGTESIGSLRRSRTLELGAAVRKFNNLAVPGMGGVRFAKQIYLVDLPAASFSLQCYSLSEVLIEKMAALMGRTEPRDLYDFWHLTENERMNTRDHGPEFERKAKNKKHDPIKFEERALAKERNLKQGWERKLENQINDLPRFDDVFREAKRCFRL